MKYQDTETPVGDIDLASILIEVEPGYVAIEDPAGSQQILITQSMEISPGVMASVGFALDGADGVLGKPVFLHRRMQIRLLGTLDEYLEDAFVQSQLGDIAPRIDRCLGVLPIIAVIEAMRIDPGADITALVAAVLERRQALRASANDH